MLRYGRTSIIAALALLAGLGCPLAAQKPRPDPKALEAAENMQRSRSSAALVAREMLSSYRQSGPQTLLILTTVGYDATAVGRALSTEAGADANTAARWSAQAELPAGSAWRLVRETGVPEAAAMRALQGSGFRLADVLVARSSIDGAKLAVLAKDLREAGVGARDAGDAMRVLTHENARATAQEMIGAGYSIVDVAIALRDSFGLRDDQIGMLLIEIDVDAIQVFMAWLDPAYGLNENDAIEAFHRIDGRADHATAVLRERGRNAAQVAYLLSRVGYSAIEVGDALVDQFQLPAAAVVDAMVDGDMAFAMAAAWADHAGRSAAAIVSHLKAAGADGPENASGMIAGSVINATQSAAWALWAGQAGYDCTQTAQGLKAGFGQPPEAAAAALPPAGCTPGDVAQAINAAWGPTLPGLAALLIQAGFDGADLIVALQAVDDDPEAVAQAMSDAGQSLNQIAEAMHDAGITPEKIAEVVLSVLNPTPIAVAAALKLAGCTQPEVQKALLGIVGDPKLILEILAQVF